MLNALYASATLPVRRPQAKTIFVWLVLATHVPAVIALTIAAAAALAEVVAPANQFTAFVRALTD